MADPLTVIGGLAAILDVSSRVVNLIRAAKGATNDRQKLIAEINNATALCQTLKDYVEISGAESWAVTFKVLDQNGHGPLAQFEQNLKYIEAKLGKKGFTLTWPFTKESIQDMLISMERQKSMFALAMTNDSLHLAVAINAEVKEVSQGVDAIRKSQDTEIRKSESSRLEVRDGIRGIAEGIDVIKLRQKRDIKQQILSRLTSIDFDAVHNDITSRRTDGTGNWFLETNEMLSWLKNPCTLWCHGIPGSGKTILASLVLDTLRAMAREDPSLGVAGIYCSYKEAENPSNLIGSLVRQLAEPLEAIPQAIEAPDRLDALYSLLGFFSKVIMVVDALDECTDRSDLMKQLETMRRMMLRANIHLLVTSRKGLIDVERTLTADLRLEISSHDQDVRIFLQQSLRANDRLSDCIAQDIAFEGSITDTILGNLSGMFLLARLHMDLLADIPTKRDVRKALHNLPNGTDNTYMEAWCRIIGQKTQQAHIGKQILSWVVYTFRPLKVKEMQYALAIEPGDEELDCEGLLSVPDLTSFCAGLVVIDEKSNMITLVHPTTQ